jgi:formamidopyrimidine-DNA glycosylase
MPELPEVETIRRGLVPVLEGARITKVVLRRPDLRFPFPDRFAERLEGATIGPLARRAKFLLLPLDTGETLVIHLGMTGRLLVEQDGQKAMLGDFHHEAGRLPAHDHAVIRLESGPALIYNDVRRFGFMQLEPSEQLSESTSFADLGPEPLGNAFSGSVLATRLARRASPLKLALLDQHVVAGLGNIYVCEALHRTGLSPYYRADRVPVEKVETLAQAIRAVLEEAIEAGGSTLRDFRHEDGSLGYFQHAFRVYDRAGAPCPTLGCGGCIERQVQGGRSTFFCATCQMA